MTQRGLSTSGLVALGLACGLAGLAPSAGRAATCKDAPDPIVNLDYGSRYQADSTTRSELDPKADAEADKALKPVDDFLRDLTSTANGVFKEGADQAAISDCVIGQIAVWAEAGALTDLQSPTASLTIGSRIAGFGLVLLQVLPHTTRTDDVAIIKPWLAGLMQQQTSYWETDAPDKARKGNLRAWAALGAATASEILDDATLRAWAEWSVGYVLCSAGEDGSLPQEMSRGKYALKYQLHAIAPLVVSSLLLERKGVKVQETCDKALSRVIGFAVSDLEDGAKTKAITGKEQTMFDGSDHIDGFHMAWAAPYLIFDTSDDRSTIEAVAQKYMPLASSKLGGDQSVIWNDFK